MSILLLRSLALLCLSAYPAAADNVTIWGAVVVSTYGDHIPLLSPNYSILTPLGAQQMNEAGTFFRGRYIDPSGGSANSTSNFTIAGISTNEIDNLQTSATALYEIFISQSAQAFMAGLYPPFNSTGNSVAAHATGSTLFNGTEVDAPLNGLQYPQIYLASALDPNSLFLNGSDNCPAFESSYNNYLATSQYTDTKADTESFFGSLAGALSSALPNVDLNYDDAFDIWDFISYGVVHTSSIESEVSDSTLAEARYLADSSYYQIYGNTTVDSGIRTIGGSSLAANLLESIMANNDTNATEYKLATYFTGVEPLISLTALLGLPNITSDFWGLPDLASSLVFELYSSSSAPLQGSDSPYPSPADLSVRFLFRNGTSNNEVPYGSLTQWPIFGRDRDQPDLTYEQFIVAMEEIAAPAIDPGTWCESCASEATWCAYFTNGADGLPYPSDVGNGATARKQKVTPAIAGVIGALVALAVAGLLLAAAMLLFGIRFRRREGGGVVKSRGAPWKPKPKRSSSGLGGFKGSEKLASDVDLPKGAGEAGGVFGASVDRSVGSGGGTSGHRRVESWELREGRGKKSFESARESEGAVKAVEAV